MAPVEGARELIEALKGRGHAVVLASSAHGDDVEHYVEAAARADLKTIGLLTGGFSEAELREAGAVDVFESPATLVAGLDRTPLR